MMMGYVLLALGVAVFVISFLIPVKSEEEKEIEFSEDLIRDLVGKEVEDAKLRLNDIVDETVTYAMEKTERTMDRITNEKMMSVSEYSDTVLSEIDKNHKEVVFLYDMLNDKHETLKTTVSEVEKQTSEIKQTMKDVEITAKETKEELDAVKEKTSEVSKQADEASKQATQAVMTAESANRTSAIDRLKSIADNAEEFSGFDVEGDDTFKPLVVEKVEEKKTARKKRAGKSKNKELDESNEFNTVAIDDREADSDANATNNVDYRPKNEAPNLNLGTDSVGKPMGGLNNNERILELHNKGKSNMAIAKELGLGLGEVKLVIGLYEGM